MTAASNSDARKREVERAQQAAHEAQGIAQEPASPSVAPESTDDANGAQIGAERFMSDAEGDAWDALHDDADIICTCDGCNYYSPTYDETRECSLTAHIKAISAAIVREHRAEAWDEGRNAWIEYLADVTLNRPINPYEGDDHE